MKPIAFVIGIILIAIMAIFWIAWVVGLFAVLPFSGFIFPGSGLTTFLASINSLVILGIPLLTLILLIMRVFMRTQFRLKRQLGLWAFWFLNVLSLAIIGAGTAKEFSHGGTTTMGSTVGTVPGDTLHVVMEESPYQSSWLRIGDDLLISDDKLVSGEIYLHFEKSGSGLFEVSQKNISRGENLSEAELLAETIGYSYSLAGDRLILPSYFTIEKGEKWRGQEVLITIKVPEGKYVERNDIPSRHIRRTSRDDNYNFPFWDREYIWQMGPNGMIAPDYISEYKQEFPFEDFSKIRLEGNIRLFIQQGDRYHIDLGRGSEYYDDINISQAGDRINISTQIDPDKVVRLDITMPTLDEVWAITSDDIEIRDFKLPHLHIVNEGEAQVKVFADVEDLQIELTGDNELDIRGEGSHMNAILSENAKLDAEHFALRTANMEVVNGSFAKVAVSDTLRQKVIDGEVVSRRNPVVVDNE